MHPGLLSDLQTTSGRLNSLSVVNPVGDTNQRAANGSSGKLAWLTDAEVPQRSD